MSIENLKEFPQSSKIKEKLALYGQIKQFQEGDIILSENSYIRSIPIVIEGSIKVMQTDEDGREILLYYITSGESCIMSFLGGMHDDKSKVRAVADDKTELLLIPIDKVPLLIREFPEWLDYIFKLYHKRFEELLEVVNAVAFKKMDVRILDLVKRKCEINQQKEISITHEQLANELGTARVVVSRLLKQMEENKLVKLSRNKISLV